MSFTHLKTFESESEGFAVFVAVHVSLPRVHVHPNDVPTCPKLAMFPAAPVAGHSPRVLSLPVIR